MNTDMSEACAERLIESLRRRNVAMFEISMLLSTQPQTLNEAKRLLARIAAYVRESEPAKRKEAA